MARHADKERATEKVTKRSKELSTPAWVYVAAAAATALIWTPWLDGISQWSLSAWLPNVLGFVLLFATLGFPVVEWIYWKVVERPGAVQPHPILRNVLIIAGRELGSYFSGSLAYVVAFFILGFSGYVFFLGVWDVTPFAEMAPVLGTMVFLTLMASPLLTMNSLAQEKATGTVELLMTRPVRDSEVVIGKYLAAVSLYLVVIALSLVYVLFIGAYGQPDWGRIISGYIGLLLAAGSFMALGILASALVSTQVAAALVGYSLALVAWLIGWIHLRTQGTVAEVFSHISVFEHFRRLNDGTIDSRGIVFFASLIVFALFVAIRAVENRRTV